MLKMIVKRMKNMKIKTLFKRTDTKNKNIEISDNKNKSPVLNVESLNKNNIFIVNEGNIKIKLNN